MAKPGGLASALSSLVALAAQLMGAELALLKAETTENAAAFASVLIFALVAVFSGLVGLVFLFFALGFFLMKLGLEPWVAWTVIAALWFLVAVVCGMIARSRINLMTVFPERTLSQLKADVAALRQGLTHG
jgi:ABC-type transport system involved in multi-copper enzyme maturation permease subunit